MNQFGLNQPLVIKKSPVVIVKNFIVLQMATMAVFFLAGVLADYGEIYEHLPLARSLSFQIAQVLGLFGVETILVFYIFFRWYKENYEIKSDKIVYGRGIVVRRKTVIPLKNIHSVSYRQGPLGRLTKYGGIELADKNANRIFTIDHIPDPKQYAELIVQIKDSINILSPIAGGSAVEDMIARGENERIEFKNSLRWDFKQNKVNKNLEKATMKTIAAFLNSDGGRLVIGVDDSGAINGLSHDYKSLPKQNSDGFQNHFTNVFHSMLGPELRQFVELSFYRLEDKECCLVSVMPANKPAYLKFDSEEEFYIRTGNGTTALRLSEAASYVDYRWRGKLL